MKPSLEDSFYDIPIDGHSVCEDNIYPHYSIFMDMIEASCIIDLQKRNFYDVSDHGFFLCGYSQSEVKSMGYKFFNKIIHPDDIQLWVDMYNIILKYLCDKDVETEEGHYFSCTFRINSGFKIKKMPYYIMAELRLRPVFVNQKLKYGLCLFTSSSVKTSGNLRVYFKRERIYREYLFTKKRGISKNMLELSLREREILMLFQQDLSRKEMADTLCVAIKTIKNTINRLFKKDDAEKMIQAETFARIHRLIYNNKTTKPKKKSLKDKK